jgi:hypothetical protein
MAKNKRLTAAQAQVDTAKAYSLVDAIKLVKATAKAKFDETVEMSMNLGIDPRHADQMVRGLTSLPNGGKTVRVGVARGEGRGSTGRRRRHGRRGRSGRENQAGKPVRPCHRHARYDGRGRQAW